jgi:hypothetical protein
VPEYIEGRVPERLFEDYLLASHPVTTEQGEFAPQDTELSEYSREEEAELRERLRGLGYLE